MTGATSTTGGGGGAAARTLPLPQPIAFSSNTALTNPVDICFIFPSIVDIGLPLHRVTGAPESGRCSVGENVAQESSWRIQARQSRDCIFLVQLIFPVGRLSNSLNSPVPPALPKQIAYQSREGAK